MTNDMFDFGEAIRRLKTGEKVCRAGWNGKGMWIALVPATEWSASVGSVPEQRVVRPLPWLAMKTADDGIVPWLASQTDVLAEDWQAANV